MRETKLSCSHSSKDLQRLKVIQIEPLNQDVWRYRFSSADNDTLATFSAGQFISLFFHIGSTVSSRPYSIASTPKDALAGFYDLIIHIHGPFVSTWIGKHLKVGDIVISSYPRGHFTWSAEQSRNVVGISGGLSMTPLLSLAKAVYNNELHLDLTLLCSWESPKEAIAIDELKRYAHESENIKLKFIFEKNAPKWSSTGLITTDLLLNENINPNSSFFCCGPKSMYDEIRSYIKKAEISLDRVTFEVPGELHDVTKFPLHNENYHIKICNYAIYSQPFAQFLEVPLHQEATTEILVRGDESLLKGLERAGYITKARCRSGNCKECIVKLISGEVFIPQDRTMLEPQLIKLCSSFPQSDIAVDFIV